MSLSAPTDSLPLFASARATDPETSREAAERATTGLSRSRETVLHLFREWEDRFHRPLTDQDLVTFAAEEDARGDPRSPLSPSGLRSRRAELTRAGLIESVGTEERDGSRHTLHRLTPAGRRLLAR